MYNTISTSNKSVLRDIFSANFAFSSAVSDEDHLLMGGVCDEEGFIEIAYMHYSSIIKNKNVGKVTLKTAKFRMADLEKRHPLLGKEITVETIQLVEKKTLISRLGDEIITQILKITIALGIIPLIYYIFY